MMAWLAGGPVMAFLGGGCSELRRLAVNTFGPVKVRQSL